MKRLLSKADVRMFLALIFSGIGGYLVATGQPVPELFAGLWGTVVGFYFAGVDNDNHREHIEKLARG